MAETTKERLNKQFAQLESERQSFEPHWRELVITSTRVVPAF